MQAWFSQFSVSEISPCPRFRAKVEAKASDSQIFVEEEEEEEEERKPGGDGHDQNLQDELNAKAGDMLKEAIINFAQSDLEEAAKKYDMEEELFAEIDFAQINAFTDRPFSGNPAAVCYLPLKRDDEWLQLVAKEFNLSETAFLMKRSSGKERPPVFKKKVEESNNVVSVDEFDLRWFTPKIEVNLCGHATLASAHLLFSSGIVEGDTIVFHTKSGALKARKVSGYNDDEAMENEDKSEDLNRKKKRPIGAGVVELDFPLISSTKCDDAEAEVVSAALGGVKIVWIGKTSLGDYLVEVSSVREVEQLQPQFSKMLNFSGRGGVIVTACADKDTGLDFVSRFFCPKSGIFEDPVTGSAHCTLGPFWAERLGKTTLRAFQASERGGNIIVRVDKSEGRAYLQGSAVLVMAGVLLNTLRA